MRVIRGNGEIEQVDKITRLDSVISSDGRNKREIIKRIFQVEITFNNKKGAIHLNDHQSECREKRIKDVRLKHKDILC